MGPLRHGGKGRSILRALGGARELRGLSFKAKNKKRYTEDAEARWASPEVRCCKAGWKPAVQMLGQRPFLRNKGTT
jgi:hypothetical protein